MRLIDADRFQFEADRFFRSEDRVLYDLTSLICMMPTIDAEVVTRCKDCKYFKIVNERLDSWGCSVLFDPYGRPLISLADDFCSNAEPKARDEE